VSDTLLLLDGHSLAYRAFFALPTSIVTSTGQVTNAVYGFTSMLIKLLTEQRTDRIGVAFDVGAPSIRLEAYPEYKANRSETPDEFRGQVELIQQVLDVLRIPRFGVPGHEADDLLATLAKLAEAEGLDVILVTADRDYLQLVREHVSVLFNRKGVSDYTLYDPAAVTDRFGLPPEKLIDLSALKGDPSDNLPSVPGIGDKTAATLVQTFGSVEALYEHLDELPSRIKRLRPALEDAHDQVLLNKKLVRLVDDLEVDIEPADIHMGEWDESAIRELFNALQFRVLLERITDVRPHLKPVGAAPEVTVRAAESAPGGARRVALSMGDSGGIAISEDGSSSTWLPSLEAARVLLEDADVEKVAHDAKTLCVRARRAGIAPAGIAFDTQVAAYLLDPAPGRYPLEDLSVRYLNRELPRASVDAGQGQLALGIGAGEGDEGQVAGARAAALLPLADRLQRELETTGMADLMRAIELPLIDVLVGLELVGVAIDVDMLRAQAAELNKRIAALETTIHDLAGGPFNLNSPPQLRTVLYERLGLKPTRRTKTGYSTDAATLESLRGRHEIVDALLEYRELSKLVSTYLEPLPALVDPADGRVHAEFRQTVVATGRIATQNPNLQNIPTRSDLGREIRRAFVAGFPGHSLLVADYSQIELRVLAHITGDPGLREAFARDEDVHAATAAKIWGFTVEEVPRDLRARAKAINFGLAYGMNKFGLAQRLGITPDEAQEHIDAYFSSFPNVAAFMEQVVKDAYRDGCTVTIAGRRRYLPELESGNPRIRSMGERQALNAPIQGSAADIFKVAMIAVDRGLRSAGLGARMVLTVHDELIFEVPDAERTATTERVRSLMEEAYPLEVPLRVDIAVGHDWATAKA